MRPLAKGRRTPLGQFYLAGSRVDALAHDTDGGTRYKVSSVPAAGDIVLLDLTANDRFGIKGNGSGNWLRSRGFRLPERINTMQSTDEGIDLVRLGNEDFALLAGPKAQSRSLMALQHDWERDGHRPKGFNAWREEVWAWFHISGEGISTLLAKTCPVDLAASRFPRWSVAQTRVAQIDCVVVRSDRADTHGFDLLFDIASSEYMLRSIEELGSTL